MSLNYHYRNLFAISAGDNKEKLVSEVSSELRKKHPDEQMFN